MSIDDYRLSEEIKKSRYDIETVFLGRWSILSGGTLSLLVPLFQSLKDTIVASKVFLFGGIFIIVSLISSLVGLFAAKEYMIGNNFIRYILHLFSSRKILVTKEELEPLFFRIKEWSALIALIAYIIGVILVFIFININLL